MEHWLLLILLYTPILSLLAPDNGQNTEFCKPGSMPRPTFQLRSQSHSILPIIWLVTYLQVLVFQEMSPSKSCAHFLCLRSSPCANLPKLLGFATLKLQKHHSRSSSLLAHLPFVGCRPMFFPHSKRTYSTMAQYNTYSGVWRHEIHM
jgi:hypothetical protein